ncbi:MAG: urea ABC transporter ATP-binding protein UrtD [Alphaproteobacteria bacterium]|jgi:urea transport system ATP-binding protein|nr:urea ABC transporter ATP-binding protein UrtD [Alphaproteobacteria bacterium]HIB17670.1 urea ABC transporter ATP-binding protein UrtD [Alphaproteobacteria bacterium]HIB55605.1 urea ABC transporter ATP-binding protein UrtD [Alphaproteobacteria bacterium]HIN91688.1 urea ABC transporter ATP-binding protein UrtD [Alphaproteobacteria bacterium]HIO01894.1 urea ABC transporter ATP-binding protein UrtD [Alphaproteobacteria bacterium]
MKNALSNRGGPAVPSRKEKQPNTHSSILYLDGVSVTFDGFKALSELSLVVEKGEMRAVIGPNGAGKTTMMDVVSGRTRPDQGRAIFNGTIDLTKLDEASIAELGIGRKFQKPTVFENQTVYQNLQLALKADRKVFPTLFRRPMPERNQRLQEVLEVIALDDHRDLQAGSLSHGQKQWLEIGMLLAQDPELLMIDEPVAGMTDLETEQTVELLRRISSNRSVLVVEHDMEFVRALDTKVTVLHEGAVLAEGSIDFVQNNERVIEVYLGR